MEVDKSEWELLQRALDEWERTGQLTASQAEGLKKSIVPRNSERQQIAQYFFFIALFCTLLAFGAIFLNEKLLEKIKAYFSWSDLVIALITALLSALWFWYIGKKRNQVSSIALEIYMVLGGLSVLTSLVYFCKEFHADKSYTTLLGLAACLLAILAQVFRSRALWIGATGAAIGWFGVFSDWQSANNLFLGMNYPMRFTALGLFILVVALLQAQVKLLSFGQRITYITGLIAFFTGLWGVSIFGNYNTLVGWEQVRQVHVLAYSVAFGIFAALSFYLGIRYKDSLARDLGVLFLLINLYTRYFEYFWDSMNKGIFFLILAITFGCVGWLLERQSRISKKTKAVNEP